MQIESSIIMDKSIIIENYKFKTSEHYYEYFADTSYKIIFFEVFTNDKIIGKYGAYKSISEGGLFRSAVRVYDDVNLENKNWIWIKGRDYILSSFIHPLLQKFFTETCIVLNKNISEEEVKIYIKQFGNKTGYKGIPECEELVEHLNDGKRRLLNKWSKPLYMDNHGVNSIKTQIDNSTYRYLIKIGNDSSKKKKNV